MNAILFEQLLYQEESESLDFKRDQYPFDGATEKQKGELLKDVIAFANSWKRSDAFILIGVDEVKGGRSNPVGIATNLDDAKLQQFINSKTNRPITFSYEAFVDHGIRFGVIQIPVQQRPFFVVKKYGRVEKETIYIRRGSSTDTAKPDEVALMGANPTNLPKPSIDLEFADNKLKEKLGKNPTLKSNVLNYDETKIPKLQSNNYLSSFVYTNSTLYIEKAKYLYETSLLSKIGFWIKNTSEILLSNVSAKIIINCESNILIKDEVDYPNYPSKDGFNISANLKFKPNSLIQKNRIDVSHENAKTDKKYVVLASFGNIRPKEEIWSKDFFCIGACEAHKLKIECIIFANNLPEPISIPLSIDFEIDKRTLDIERLYE